MPSTITFAVAFVAAVYLGYITLRRLLGDRDDPTASVAASSDTGSFTFLLSGSWYVAGLAALIVGLTWPMAMESPTMLLVLAAVVFAHYVIERRERQ